MLKLKDLTIKNFLSVGNNTQAIDLDRQDLVLVMGENLDLGGDDAGSKNGVGKTTIMNAIGYVINGEALNNIRKENLINKSNGKQMMVTLNLECNGTEYRIERGRKPNVLKFFINTVEQTAEDASQGDSRETQKQIEQILGMSPDMFRHIVALNTYTEPFLNLKANDQRMIIEQLLGITMLSEKADRLREQMRVTKDLMSQDEMRIRAVQEANVRIQQQIDSVTSRQKLWNNKQAADIDQMTQAITALTSIDLDAEIQNHSLWDQYRQQQQQQGHLKKLFSIAGEKLNKEARQLNKLNSELESLLANTCYTCGQPVKNLDQQLELKRANITEVQLHLQACNTEFDQLETQLQAQGTLSEPPSIWYDQVEDAVAHRSNLENLQRQLADREQDQNPYTEQITEMTQQALQAVDYDVINNLKRVQEHEEFLLKLLTNKDSFIRKKIIDQNLTYLNSRLRYYLLKMGLPHSVTFQNDLSVNITELGRDLDVGNLSRGECNRLILSLSWSFRDVWESLYQQINLLWIDELLDNGMDQAGVENAMAILKHMARDRGRSIWLISHRDELSGRVQSVLKVIKENGFTQFSDV
jgi:DNA repair exonuclease SbcCD ATPase subunit